MKYKVLLSGKLQYPAAVWSQWCNFYCVTFFLLQG